LCGPTQATIDVSQFSSWLQHPRQSLSTNPPKFPVWTGAKNKEIVELIEKSSAYQGATESDLWPVCEGSHISPADIIYTVAFYLHTTSRLVLKCRRLLKFFQPCMKILQRELSFEFVVLETFYNSLKHRCVA
jgi:hypothetical protein